MLQRKRKLPLKRAILLLLAHREGLCAVAAMEVMNMVASYGCREFLLAVKALPHDLRKLAGISHRFAQQP